MEWNYEESLKSIAKANFDSWKAIRYGNCVVCGSADAGYYDLCQSCQDKPIPDYDAFHIRQLFSCLHKAALSDMEVKMCNAYEAGNATQAVQAYRDYCFSFGTPGRLYYNNCKEKADRRNDLTPGCLAWLLKEMG